MRTPIGLLWYHVPNMEDHDKAYVEASHILRISAQNHEAVLHLDNGEMIWTSSPIAELVTRYDVLCHSARHPSTVT